MKREDHVTQPFTQCDVIMLPDPRRTSGINRGSRPEVLREHLPVQVPAMNYVIQLGSIFGQKVKENQATEEHAIAGIIEAPPDLIVKCSSEASLDLGVLVGNLNSALANLRRGKSCTRKMIRNGIDGMKFGGGGGALGQS